MVHRPPPPLPSSLASSCRPQSTTAAPAHPSCATRLMAALAPAAPAGPGDGAPPAKPLIAEEDTEATIRERYQEEIQTCRKLQGRAPLPRVLAGFAAGGQTVSRVMCGTGTAPKRLRGVDSRGGLCQKLTIADCGLL